MQRYGVYAQLHIPCGIVRGAIDGGGTALRTEPTFPIPGYLQQDQDNSHGRYTFIKTTYNYVFEKECDG